MKTAPIIITLSNSELMMAANIGSIRNITSIRDGRRDANGFKNEHGGWNIHIEGAAGEIALSKALNVYWSPSVNMFHGPDIGKEIQVRTRSHDDYDLIVRTNDDPSHIYFLLTGTAPTFIVRGWILGYDARRDVWWKSYGGRSSAWFVPQDALEKDIKGVIENGS